MNEDPSIIELLQKNAWRPNKIVLPEEIAGLEKKFGIRLPQDYKDILLFSNGGSLYGFRTPLIIFSIREVLALYREHDLYTDIPDTLIFGGDGGGTLYVYDLRVKNEQGKYPVFFVREDEIGYDASIYDAPDLTSIIRTIIDKQKIN